MAIGAAVVNHDQGLADSLTRGYTLPADWYTSPAVLDLEHERIFHRFWQYVGYTEQVAQPGDAFSSRIGNASIVVARDQDGALHAYLATHNQVKQATDPVDPVTPQRDHSHTPASNHPSRTVPIKVEAWGPLIFANVDPYAAPLCAQLGQLPDIVAAAGLDLAALRFRARRSYDVAANWKVVVENYNECYHCPVAHPSFADLFDMDTYKVVTAYEYFSLQHGTVSDSFRAGAERGYFDVREEVLDAGIKDGMSAYIWPASSIDVSPGPANLAAGMNVPLGPHRTVQIYDSFFAAGTDEEQAQGIMEFGQQVQAEDIVLCESVQRGLRSGFFEQGRLIVNRENGIQHFQQLVYRALSA